MLIYMQLFLIFQFFFTLWSLYSARKNFLIIFEHHDQKIEVNLITVGETINVPALDRLKKEKKRS